MYMAAARMRAGAEHPGRDVAGASVRTPDLLFYIPFVIYLASEILRTSFYARYLPGSGFVYLGFAAVLVLREILFEQYDRKTWILFALTLVICANVFRVSSMASAVMFLFIFAARNLAFRDIARIGLVVTAVALAFVILSAYAGWIQDYKFIGVKRVRRYLGFGYALFPGAYLSEIAMLYIWLYRRRVSLIVLAVFEAINYWIYLQTDARLSFHLLTALLLAALVLRIFPRFLEHIRAVDFAMVFSFPICALISILITTRYNTAVAWMSELNTRLGRRLFLGQKALNRYGITLLGKRVNWVGNGLDEYGRAASGEYTYVDNLYVQYLVNYGLIVAVILLALLTYGMYRMYKAGQYYLLVLFLLLAAHALLDDLIYKLQYNLFWMLIPMAIIRGDVYESQ